MKKLILRQNILPSDIKEVSKIISGWLTHGKYTDLFEKELSKQNIQF